MDLKNIVDNGNGIDRYNMNRIFDPFYTTKELTEGSGFGLFIVKDLMLKLNLEINVQLTPNIKTEFKILFGKN